MSQVPTIVKYNIAPKVLAVGVGADTGPMPGQAPPDSLDGKETLNGRFGLYHKGTKFGTVHSLVKINGKYVIQEIAGYVCAMINDAKDDGVELRVTSGFRTMEEQRDLFKQRSATLPAAKPGFGSHQTGIAVDFNVYEHKGKVYEWLVKNAYRYGFIRTVPNERWHWEYWGYWQQQQTPFWAGGNRATDRPTNFLNHRAMSMYSKVPKIHACGDQSFGGEIPMQETGWWTSNGATGEHTDKLTMGKTNSWIGISNEFLPDKLNREDPNWTLRKF